MYDLSKLDAVALSLSPFTRDCAITVALKITDDSCKMDAYEKSVFMALYDALPEYKSEFFAPEVFELIQTARVQPSASLLAQIKKFREAGMDFITRPKMKAFKAKIRVDISA